MGLNNLNSKKVGGKIVYPELSYKIVGAAFNTFNELDWGLPERSYQQALATELGNLGISFKREVYVPLKYKDSKVGRYYADFLVEDKILLETKIVSKFGFVHVKQLLNYLQSAGVKLGILIYFTKDGVKYRRVVNPKVNFIRDIT